MYILIKEEYVTNGEVRARYHKSLPDGRLILTPQELKVLGSVPECQIVATKLEVDNIIDEQSKEGVQPMEGLQPATPAGDVSDAPTGTEGSEDAGNPPTEATDGTGAADVTEAAEVEGTENGNGGDW